MLGRQKGASERGATTEGAVLGGADHRVAEFGLGALLAVFALLSAFPPSGAYLLPFVTVPGFALGSLHFLRRAFDSAPRVSIDDHGITDRTSIAGGTLHIPWSQIRRVSSSAWHNGVQLEVADLDDLERRAGWRRRIGIRLARIVGKRTVTVDTTLLGLTKSELAARLTSALHRHERRDLGLADGSRVSSGA